MMIPQMLLRKLYTYGSLRNTGEGLEFSLKNRLNDVTLTRVVKVRLDAMDIEAKDLEIDAGDGKWRPATSVSEANPENFPLKAIAFMRAPGKQAGEGLHKLEISLEVKGMGVLTIKVEDNPAKTAPASASVPLDKEDNYTPEIILARQKFIEAYSNVQLKHINKYSFDPYVTKGNIENFVGVAQVPLGFAGPLRVNGEHAVGEFIIPLATA